jgi:hypothetical protein
VLYEIWCDPRRESLRFIISPLVVADGDNEVHVIRKV